MELAGRYGLTSPLKGNEAKQLALFLYRKFPVIYAGQDHLEAAAFRWKCQIHENAKQAALMGVVSEMNHNEISGFTTVDELTRKMAVVLLRHPQGDHPRVAKRFDLLKKVLKGKTGGVREVRALGKSLLAQMLSVLYLGDFVSVYLAYLKGVDPSAVDLIEGFKKLLNRSA